MEMLVKLSAKDVQIEGAFEALENLCKVLSDGADKVLKIAPPQQEKKVDIKKENSDSSEKKTVDEEPKNTDATSEKGEYTIEAVRKAFGDLANAKGKDAAKELLNNLGAKKVTDLTDDKYSEAMKMIKELE